MKMKGSKNNAIADLRGLYADDGELVFKSSPEQPLVFVSTSKKTGIKYVVEATEVRYQAFRKDGSRI